MAYDWSARRATATMMITKYGTRAILRRDEGDRDCIACEIQRSTRSQQGQLRNYPERTFLVVADGLSPAPDAEKDHFIWFDPDGNEEALRLVAPIDRLAPGGVVLYWELQTRP